MKTLHVIVSNKVATYLRRDGYIVCGNADNQIEFTFDKEWDAYERKTARFIWRGKPVDVEFSGNVCPVPIVANTEELKVGVYVENLSTTTSAVIPCRLSVLCDSKTEAEGKVVIPDGTPVLGEATITENGEHYPGEGYDGFYKVTVKVPTEIPEGYIKPKDTKPITENGTHDVTKYAAVEVNVPTGSGGEQYLGEYVDGTGYKTGAIVSYNGNIYICIKDLDDMQDPTNAEYWRMLNEEGEGEVIPEISEPLTLMASTDGAEEGEVVVAYSLTEKVALPAATNKQLGTLTDANFIKSNIKKDVYIFGLKGEYEGNVKQNYCLVRFYNDDRTTLLYEVIVPYGSSAVYAGDAPVSSLGANYTFTGFEPSTANVTADTDCYAVYDESVVPDIGTLESTSWEQISEISEAGTGENYFAVGDTKSVYLKGTVGTLELDTTLYVYILGFNHNSEVEGNGIHFGTFKSAASNGIDLCLVDSKYGNTDTSGTKYFNMNHWGNSSNGGWAGCDMRYDILGSTDKAPSGYGASPASGRTGYDPSATCATTPVAGTLMAALPSDLRAVMKPMTKYTDNTGASGDTEAKVTVTTDYLPLLAEVEIYGARTNANSYEQSKQKQYDYFAAGNSKKKYHHSATGSAADWWERSAYYVKDSFFCGVNSGGNAGRYNAYWVNGVAPAFKV